MIKVKTAKILNVTNLKNILKKHKLSDNFTLFLKVSGVSIYILYICLFSNLLLVLGERMVIAY